MARRTEPDLHGLIVVDKPAGHTSHDVVARVRRLTGIRRVGHAGTLDPFATGVVVVAVGRATRMLQFVQDTDKVYLAHIVLGAETDSADVDGKVIARTSPDTWPTEEQLLDALREQTGSFEQVPPAFSAIKVGGQPLYRKARAGIDVDVPSRTVVVHGMHVVEYNPPDVVVAIHCGKGTYVRAIARDLGAALGTLGYCHGLRRLATGAFAIDQAWSIEALEALDPYEHWHEIALHPDFALYDTAAVILSGTELQAWYHGQSFANDRLSLENGSLVRMYGPGGEFAGVGSVESPGRIKPRFVFQVAVEGE